MIKDVHAAIKKAFGRHGSLAGDRRKACIRVAPAVASFLVAQPAAPFWVA